MATFPPAFLPPSSSCVSANSLPLRRQRRFVCPTSTNTALSLSSHSCSSFISPRPLNSYTLPLSSPTPLNSTWIMQSTPPNSSSSSFKQPQLSKKQSISFLNDDDNNYNNNIDYNDDDMESASATKGFALSDAQIYNFETLKQDETPFQVGGAYAISNDSDVVVYMGYTKNISTKLQFHQHLQPDQCITFRIYVPPVPPELMSPDLLENVLEYWVQEIGSVPRGNAIDRALWEQENPIDRKSKTTTSTTTNSTDNVDDIPIRERTTSRRKSVRSNDAPKYYTSDPFGDAYRSLRSKQQTQRQRASASSSSTSSSWDATDEDYVEVDVDPFDPFSASNRARSTRSSWNELENDDNNDDWYPIFLIMGFGGIVWLFSLLSNALPAATPSLGM